MSFFKKLLNIFKSDNNNNSGECPQCGGDAVSFYKNPKTGVITYKCSRGHTWDE